MKPSYAELVRQGKAAVGWQWTLGDLALKVETTYADRSLEKYAEDIGIPLKTLQAYRTVAAAYEKSIRMDNVPWTIYQIFAARADRVKIVEGGNPETGKPWSAASARKYVAEWFESPTTEESGEDATADRAKRESRKAPQSGKGSARKAPELSQEEIEATELEQGIRLLERPFEEHYAGFLDIFDGIALIYDRWTREQRDKMADLLEKVAGELREQAADE